MNQTKLTFKLTCGSLVCLLFFATPVSASENAPQPPFAQWADVPEAGQFILGMVYQQSEAYHMWADGKIYNVTTTAGGEFYGTDILQGYFALQYGINERWAADLSFGYTSCAWRYFDNGTVQYTEGLLDTSVGVRYQFFKDGDTNQAAWLPTLTFRTGAVLPGTYDQKFVFAPGYRSAAVEPELLIRKHFGWPGLGAYGDILYRWEMTTHNDLYIASVGVFQEYKGWELDLGYRRLQCVFGSDIIFDPSNPSGIVYPIYIREVYDAIEGGVYYTTPKWHWKWGVEVRSVLDGNNSDAKLWVGGSLDIPIGGKKAQ